MNIDADSVMLRIGQYQYYGNDRFGNRFFGAAFFDESIEITNLKYLKSVEIDLRTQVKTITVSNCPSLVKLYIYDKVKQLNIDGCPHLKVLNCSQSTPGLDLSHLSELERLTVQCPSVLLPDKKFKLLNLKVEKINLTCLHADELVLPIELYQRVGVMSGGKISVEASKPYLRDFRHKKNNSPWIELRSSGIVLCCEGLKLCWLLKDHTFEASPCCMFVDQSNARRVLPELLMAYFLK